MPQQVRRDWYLRRDATTPAAAPVAAATRRPRPVVRKAPAWQSMGAMVASGVLALGVVGALVFSGGAGAQPQEVVAGQSVTRQQAPVTAGTTTGEAPLAGTETDRGVLGAIAKSLEGRPTFDGTQRLSEEDIQRLADATGLPPEQLTPMLAQLVATGQLGAPQVVAGVQVQRTAPTATPRPAARATATARTSTPQGSYRLQPDGTIVWVESGQEVVAGEQARRTPTPVLNDSSLLRPGRVIGK